MGLIILLGGCALYGFLVYLVSKAAIGAVVSVAKHSTPEPVPVVYQEPQRALSQTEIDQIRSSLILSRHLQIIQEMDRIVEMEKQGEISTEERDDLLNSVFDSPEWENIKKSVSWRF